MTLVKLGAVLLVLLLTWNAARADTLKACDQSVDYAIRIPDAQVPAVFHGFSGVWSGKWESGLCSVLVVESIAPDGTANLLYLNGAMGGQYPVKAGSRRFPGKINGNKLVSSGNGVTTEYTLRAPTDLAGKYTASFGSFSGSFKKQ